MNICGHELNVREWLELNVEYLRSLACRCGKLKSIQVSKQLTKLLELEVSGCSDFKELPGQVLNIWSRWRNWRHVAGEVEGHTGVDWQSFQNYVLVALLPERVCFPPALTLWLKSELFKLNYKTSWKFIWYLISECQTSKTPFLVLLSFLVPDFPSKRSSRGEVSGMWVQRHLHRELEEHKGVGAADEASKLWCDIN